MLKSGMDPKKAKDNLVSFIKNEVRKSGLKRAIIGLSGGLDSTVVAHLCVNALGSENVIGVIMPYETSDPESINDAQMVAKELGIKTEKVDITPMIKAYFDKFPQEDRIRIGNKMARERMSILYDLSRVYDAMVVGTGNKTETLLGYGTIYGDMACGIAPLANIYKSQERELAKYLQVPPKILNKVPTADLWPGQTDEGELGIDYPTMDHILGLLVDKKMTVNEATKKGYKAEDVRKINGRVRDNAFKRKPPLAPK